ncbi:ABC-type spermidine/putrescine transport system, ATPase component [Weissella oryzae SG25]|uniref:ABC-type spermidine/putrescine transport system, ATPase component n=1 Tax=Weissella oryzae (strain DSM 25784 / JCM 18191 / LMG 30913 / SG25) TaxID=1329250 RepID=A0A069CSS5_WEIOS|nr:hypothetical protein [Weissella oryzae]GAK30457.1 ABC-type spermidine/putrescine transport system, ATPase component [Weissella oryzae SG25]
MNLNDFKIATSGMDGQRLILLSGAQVATMIEVKAEQVVLQTVQGMAPLSLAELRLCPANDTLPLFFLSTSGLVAVYGYRVIENNLQLG